MTALRVAAFAIAILAMADPAVTSSRPSRPLISMVVADSARDAVVSDRVAHEAGTRFTIVRGSIPTAGATVLIGNALPDETTGLSAPLVAVMPSRSGTSVRIAALAAPAVSPLNARMPVDANVRVQGARGRRVTVELMDGDVVVDRRFEAVESDSASLAVILAYAPTMAGSTLLRARARIEQTLFADSATTVVEATEDRFEVLFFDPRASWLSTFVRRAVERDPRFAVTHRVVTSRGMANTGGAAPASLRDTQVLSQYGTIVVGAPEKLTAADVDGLEAFMRSRGGRVVLLMERRAAGPVDRLTGAFDWHAVRLPAVSSLNNTTPDPRFPIPALRAQEIAWPATLPAGATALGVVTARDSTRRPVVWSSPVGAGRLLVSGALDAWHYRDAASGFDTFWTNAIAELTAGAPREVVVSVTRRSIAPGQETSFDVWIRDAALSTRVQSAAASAILAGNDTTMVRLWPGASPGTFTGTIVAPQQPGRYRLVVASGTSRSETPMIVDPAARAPARDERHLIEAFVSSRSGRVIPESDLEDLPRQLLSALQSVSRVETWHPMRSEWWIVPFALLLGAEWWWRRRRGLA